jgi:hypothetical protein
MTSVSGVLLVDLTAAADKFGYIDGRAAGHLLPAIPAGVCVELQIGPHQPLDGLLGPLIEALRPAGSVIVVGTSATGVSAVYQALRAGLARHAA